MARYGANHRILRRQWKSRVDAGGVTCWRCGRPIRPGDAWDLGHDDEVRDEYRGPEHTYCNRSAAAILGNQRRGKRTSRDW